MKWLLLHVQPACGDRTGRAKRRSRKAQADLKLSVCSEEPLSGAYRWLVGFLVTLAVATSIQAQTDRAEPVEHGFFFYDGVYVEAPYIVELRGFDVYINDVLVRKGPPWPPYDYRVSEDPGDPPPGVSPFDPPEEGQDRRDIFFFRKYRHLLARHDVDTARSMMVEMYRKSTEITAARLEGASAIVTDRSGREHRIYLEPATTLVTQPPPPREEFVERVEQAADFYRTMLDQGIAFFKFSSGGELKVTGPRVAKTLEILTSDMDEAAKVQALVDEKVLQASDDVFLIIVTNHQASPQLERRLQEWKQNRAQEAKTQRLETVRSQILEDYADFDGNLSLAEDPEAASPRDSDHVAATTRSTTSAAERLTGASQRAGWNWTLVLASAVVAAFAVLSLMALILWLLRGNRTS